MVLLVEHTDMRCCNKGDGGCINHKREESFLSSLGQKCSRYLWNRTSPSLLEVVNPLRCMYVCMYVVEYCERNPWFCISSFVRYYSVFIGEWVRCSDGSKSAVYWRAKPRARIVVHTVAEACRCAPDWTAPLNSNLRRIPSPSTCPCPFTGRPPKSRTGIDGAADRIDDI